MSEVQRNDPFAFLGAHHGMGALIRAFDWASTPLGELAHWPAPLRCATSLVLMSKVPMTLLWGEKGIMIYNDAYQVFAGQRHPALLGSEVLKGWPEVADFNANVLNHVLHGNVLSYEDQPLVLWRKGEPENVWLTLDYSPVLDENGHPVAGLAVVKETTAKVLAEQRLRIAQEVGGIGAFEWYPRSGRVEASDQYRRIWGLEPDAPINDAILLDRIHPDDRHLSGRQRLDTGNPISYSEFRIVAPDTGHIRWVARRGEAVAVDQTKDNRYIGIVLDISERKQAEEAAAESDIRWRGLFDQMQEGFFIAEALRDADGKIIDFVFLEVNPAFGTQTGLDGPATVGKSFRETVPGIDQSLIDPYVQVIESGSPVQLEVQIPELESRWFEARARRISQSRIAVLFVDISQRKLAEEAMRESEVRFRSMAQSMPNQIWTADAHGQLNWFNERVYSYSGDKPGALDGQAWARIVHPDDIDGVTTLWAHSVRTGEPYHTEFRLRRNDGIYRWYSVRAIQLRNKAGAIERWIGNNADIEEQKEAEAQITHLALSLEQRVEERTAELLRTQEALRQSQKMEAIGKLTGGIAHDFNNLLQVISGNLQLLSDQVKGNSKAEKRVENAMSGVGRGAKLASQLLSFGRRQPLAPKVVNTARLIRDMDELFRRCLGEGVELETIISGGLWNTLIDSGNLENALLNLAINARDAMNGQGRLTVEAGNAFLDDQYVKAHPEVTAGQYVLIAVTDTGCGIAPDLLEKVFEPFFTTKPEGRGTGLGLSMVYGFVKQSEGHIKLYSEVGHGTTVKLYLPRSRRSEDTSVAPIDGLVLGGTETILVVEDDDSVRETVVAMLTELGYRVLKARDAMSALSIIESGIPIDLLFTDVVMPGELRSPELAKKAAQRLPGLAVLFTSGYTENAIVHGGRLDEGLDLLSKPYARDDLAQKIRYVLGRKEAQNHHHSLQAKPEVHAGNDSLRILFVEDEEPIRSTVAEMLRSKNFIVIEATDAASAIKAYGEQTIDLLLTDVGLQRESGIELAKTLREQNDPNLPVVFATGRFDEDHIPDEQNIAVVNKPFGVDELLRAINALVSKTGSDETP